MPMRFLDSPQPLPCCIAHSTSYEPAKATVNGACALLIPTLPSPAKQDHGWCVRAFEREERAEVGIGGDEHLLVALVVGEHISVWRRCEPDITDVYRVVTGSDE